MCSLRSFLPEGNMEDHMNDFGYYHLVYNHQNDLTPYNEPPFECLPHFNSHPLYIYPENINLPYFPYLYQPTPYPTEPMYPGLPFTTAYYQSSALDSCIPWEPPSKPDKFYSRTLHKAIMEGLTEYTSYLISLATKSTDLDGRNKLGETAVHIAARYKQAKILRNLISAGASTRYIDNKGNSALQVAVMAGDLLCVQALITPVKACEVNAAGLQYTPSVLLCINTTHYNNDGLACVHLAFSESKIEILKYLVQVAHADINAKKVSGNTCFHIACLSGNESLVKAVVELGADPSIKNNEGHTPYDLAQDHPKIRQLLHDCGAVPEAIQEMEVYDKFKNKEHHSDGSHSEDKNIFLS